MQEDKQEKAKEIGAEFFRMYTGRHDVTGVTAQRFQAQGQDESWLVRVYCGNAGDMHPFLVTDEEVADPDWKRNFIRDCLRSKNPPGWLMRYIGESPLDALI